MDKVKSKINIFFTTSYVIILGLAIPTVTNTSATPQCVSTNQSAESSTSDRSSTLGDTVKIVTLAVNNSKKNNKNSFSALGSNQSAYSGNGSFVSYSERLYENRLRKSDLLCQLATIKLLN